MSFKISLLNSDNETVANVDASENQTILQSLLDAKIKLDHVCGGNATCGTCRFYLVQGNVTAPTKLEKEMIEDRNMRSNERLSCQTKPKIDLVLKIPSLEL
jgi:2Fe-2S ferredoxin